ncbi:hypothetical protein K432DRAFT_427797 [Lepidopterella palustris CBS 459.81]|uniref:DNA-directed RNA polymerase III subunit Rpc5 n=1 Tax=Lepidopterella palustris CBS 459.81 TaxID=1314670 RepID=A0A8E2E5T1_9PEZI|nr:hypothetical protein K432DRAFT_427797 [Lepidopterella palustris CBS 459.81]
MSPAAIDLDDDDPVVAEYDVFITPELEEKAYLLQYLNRSKDQPYNYRKQMQPMEMRIKENAGFIEVDVPLNVHYNYNRVKGVGWGEALRKAKDDNQTAFGVASGFERVNVTRGGGAAGRPGRSPANHGGLDMEDDIDDYLRRFDDANEKGHVLNKQTLGGQILKDEPGMPKYMLGTFRGNELHLTRLDGIVQMRPQFHHIDAMAQQEIVARRRERDAADAPKASEPRAVQMQVKSADGENVEQDSTKKFLRAAHEEKWTKLRYHDEDSPEAYALYNEKLFVEDTKSAPKLRSSMNNEEYLDAISAPRIDPSDKVGKKRPLTRKQMHAADESDESDDSDEGPLDPSSDPHMMDVDQDGARTVAKGA